MDIEDLVTRASFNAFGRGRMGSYNGQPDIPVILDHDYEVYVDDEQLPQRVTTICVQVSDVPESRRGDTILRAGKTWRVSETLEDDGYERRLAVT